MAKIKKILTFFATLFFSASFANIAGAVCPVCVVAVGAGLGLSRWLGVDDLISSLWIGGLLASLSIWTVIWLKQKGWNFKFYKIVIPAAYYVLTLYPLWQWDVIGHPLNKIFGIDRIFFGSMLGTAIFLASVLLHNFLKKKNNGKSYFPYQKVVVPFVILLIFSLILWMIIQK
jgi:hypothetical protein